MEVEPINFYSDYSQIIDKAFQRQGLGRKLLLWGISGQGFILCLQVALSGGMDENSKKRQKGEIMSPL